MKIKLNYSFIGLSLKELILCISKCAESCFQVFSTLILVNYNTKCHSWWCDIYGYI